MLLKLLLLQLKVFKEDGSSTLYGRGDIGTTGNRELSDQLLTMATVVDRQGQALVEVVWGWSVGRDPGDSAWWEGNHAW